MANTPNPGLAVLEEVLERCINVCRADDLRVVTPANRYLRGDHPKPYVPDNADAEFKKLSENSIINLFPLIINSITESCYVEGIRHSKPMLSSTSMGELEISEDIAPEMQVWQKNRMDSRQLSVTRALAGHGIVYGLTRRDERTQEPRLDFFAADRAATLYGDPVNDTEPEWGMVIKRGLTNNPQLMWLFNESHWWVVRPRENGSGYQFTARGEHGMSRCPVNAARLHSDLDGYSQGFVVPYIRLQNQVNQTSFDLLAAQSWSSFKIRTVSGMATPIVRWSREQIEKAYPEPDPASPTYVDDLAVYNSTPRPVPGDPVLDDNGEEIPLPIQFNQKRFLVADDPDTKFGSLDETSLTPIDSALESKISRMAAATQTPPTYLIREMANLSAEALQTAEIAKTRRDGMVRMVLAELYESQLQLAMELLGEGALANDEGTEIVWADTDPRSLAAIADGLGKMAEMLGVPQVALWAELPGMTPAKLRQWVEMKSKSPSLSEDDDTLIRKISEHDALMGLEGLSGNTERTSSNPGASL